VVELREKTPTDRRRWLEAMWVEYHDDLLSAGMTAEEAARNVERNREQLFVDGEPVEGQFMFDVLDDGEPVGSLWLGTRPESREWYIYDIVVDEGHRGKGLGRATMVAAEEYATAHGGSRLALNVFGPNVVARKLYESMDYQVMAVSMFKDLS
jgi:ribosomal protein S18 acetylase RimI-like enzyme